MSKIHDLALALRRAEAAAIAADPGENGDGGSCNFDTVVLRLPGWRAKDIAKAAELSGVRVEKMGSKWLGATGYWVWCTMHGQANRRTAMMEAAYKVLRNDEHCQGIWSAVGYYQMD